MFTGLECGYCVDVGIELFDSGYFTEERGYELMPRNEALELVKSIRRLLDTVDPRYIHWDTLKREMDELIAREEARPQPVRVVVKKVTTKPKKGGNKKGHDGLPEGLDYTSKGLI